MHDANPGEETPAPSLSLLEALEFEHAALLPGEEGASGLDPAERMRALVRRLHGARRSALCLSGGGIRSATFNLGVIQALARAKLLGRFDYLSTVSGGGFVGGWLQAWMAREGQAKVLASMEGPSTSPWPGTAPGPGPEARPLGWLRAFSNYLSPHLGVLSGDTWAIVGSLVRNLLLNWLILLPILAACLTIPHFYHLITRGKLSATACTGLMVLAGLLFAGAIAAALSIRHDGGKPMRNWRVLLDLSLAQLILGSVSLTLAIGSYKGAAPLSLSRIVAGTLLTVGLGALMSLHALPRGSRFRAIQGLALGTLFAGLAGGAAMKCLTALATMHSDFRQGVPFSCLAVPYTLGIAFVVLSLVSAVRSGFSPGATLDREWHGRYGGLVLMMALAWALLIGLGLWGPHLLTTLPGALGFATTGAGASAIALWGAWTPKGTGKEGNRTFLTYAPPMAALLVLAGILVGLAVLLDWGIVLSLGESVKNAAGPMARIELIHSMALEGERVHPAFLVAVLAGGLSVGLAASLLLRINAFSLHEFYRTRLVRAYLGASNLRRVQDPFIGMDAADDLPLGGLREAPGADKDPVKLFPVFNMALNLVHGDNLAWQERRAEPFAATPLHAGSPCTGFRPTAQYGGPGGLSLGTAMAISGAAANPNMGCHSSSILAFLMTFFNLRLGVWMGNPGPRGDDTWRKPDPRFPLWLLVSEALGRTTSDHPYVSLSDGGHFENLGLYQMVLRRCRTIVVCDAGADPDYTLGDLGNAIRKIRIDLGIRIEFGGTPNTWPSALDKDRGPGSHWAKGVIHYEDVDDQASPGTLYYLKPVLRGLEPADVVAYSHANPGFPQQPTSNQFFPESQFESYRQLGEFTVQGWHGAVKNQLVL